MNFWTALGLRLRYRKANLQSAKEAVGRASKSEYARQQKIAEQERRKEVATLLDLIDTQIRKASNDGFRYTDINCRLLGQTDYCVKIEALEVLQAKGYTVEYKSWSDSYQVDW